MTPRLVAASIALARLGYAWSVVGVGSLVACLWVLAETVAGVLGLLNALQADEWDTRPIGYLVPGLYAGSFLVVPTASVPPLVPAWVSAGFLGGVLLLVLWSRLVLGQAFSSGSSNFVGLVTSGPWACCRHPLLALGLLQRAVFAVAFPCLQNLGVVLYGLGMAVMVARLEETFLHIRCPAYRDYRERVPSRFLPLRRGEGSSC